MSAIFSLDQVLACTEFVFQVIQVISSEKNFSAEEVDLSFNSKTKEHPQISKPSFRKRDIENVFLSDTAPTNKICRRASIEQRPRTRSCHESERYV